VTPENSAKASVQTFSFDADHYSQLQNKYNNKFQEFMATVNNAGSEIITLSQIFETKIQLELTLTASNNGMFTNLICQ